MDIFNEFYVNRKMADEGVWEQIGDAKVKVASTQSTIYQKRLMEEVRKRGLFDPNTEGHQEKMSELVLDLFAECILLDWENVQYQGKSLDYNHGNARMALKVDAFFGLINGIALHKARYREAMVEKAEKNLPKRSAGKSK